MFRPLLTALGLAFLLAGCGHDEMHSPECDQGQPVLVSGRIALDDRISEGDVSRLAVALQVYDGVSSSPLALASLDEPHGYPVAFTICADLSQVDPTSHLSLSVTARRTKVPATPVTNSGPLARDELPSLALNVTLTPG